MVIVKIHFLSKLRMWDNDVDKFTEHVKSSGQRLPSVLTCGASVPHNTIVQKGLFVIRQKLLILSLLLQFQVLIDDGVSCGSVDEWML